MSGSVKNDVTEWETGDLTKMWRIVLVSLKMTYKEQRYDTSKVGDLEILNFRTILL